METDVKEAVDELQDVANQIQLAAQDLEGSSIGMCGIAAVDIALEHLSDARAELLNLKDLYEGKPTPEQKLEAKKQ